MALLLLNVALVAALLVMVWRYLLLRERLEGDRPVELPFLRGLARMIDACEGYGEAHADRLATLALAVGERLGLAEEQAQALQLAALLHDCGELQLPRELFRHARGYDADEWFLVRTHPVLGELALRRDVAPLSAVPSLVRWHHERFDGLGYPDRLVGEEIPLACRILAAADAFVAMTSARAHRPARSPAEALLELRRLAGLQFDPQVVEALVAVGAPVPAAASGPGAVA